MKVTYDASFYAAMQDANLASARVVAPLVLDAVGPIASVVDVGCGRGLWLQAFHEAGVQDIFGVDGPWVQPSELVIPPDSFSSREMESAIAVGRTADLAISLEVAEHLSPVRADDFVAELVGIAPVLLFSAAIPGQGGTDHRNEQWPAYWVEKFAQHGYVPIDAIRRTVWDNPKVSFFYAQNIAIFVKESEIERYPKLAALRAHGFDTMPALVHPTLFTLTAQDAFRWKLVVPYINKLPLKTLKWFKKILVAIRGS